MNKRIVSFVLMLFMVLACVPVVPFAVSADATNPTIRVMEDVYGKPGQTVAVKVGFANVQGKKIQKFEVVLSAGDATVVTTTKLQMVPAPAEGAGYANGNNGSFGYAYGAGGFDANTYAVVEVTIPESAKDGDVYDLTLTASSKFPEALTWDNGASADSVVFEGAKLYVSRYNPVEISVQDAVAEIGQSQIRVPVVMSATDGKLASCAGLGFSLSGSAAEKVAINLKACKEYKIMGQNEAYTVVLPDTRSFTIGFASGFENAVVPSGDDFRIFELVFDVLEPLTEGDSFTVTPSGVDCFKAYGSKGTETVTLYVSEYHAGTVSAKLPYEWTVLDEDAATARLDLYTGNAANVVVPTTVVGNGTVGTVGKEYTVVELFGDNENYEGVFYGNETVVSIVIPESVKKIDEYAISECPELAELTVMSPDLEIVENDGETFLHYFLNKKTGYVLPEDLVIRSYESATVRAWATEYDASFFNLITLVGAQIGDEGVRFVGAVSSLYYQSVDVSISVEGTDKSFNYSATSVYRTLNGKLNGVKKPAATTVLEIAEETGAYYVDNYAYLYGYAVSGVPADGSFVFKVTPTAVTAGGATVAGETVYVRYENGKIVSN